MATSPIETFIRSRPDRSREDAFREFLETPRIREWTNGDPTRVARLRTEFVRAWDRVREGQETVEADAAGGSHVTSSGSAPSNPAPDAPASGGPRRTGPERVEVHKVGAETDARWARYGKITHSVMCPKCGSVNLHAHLQQDVVNIRCRQCDSVYGDLLELIPVRRVGPFQFLFGEGVGGFATATALLVGLLLLYGVLRWGV